MNNFDLNNELARNESDKQLVYAELEASRNKWVDYLIQNKNDICTTHHPTVVKKKNKEILKGFIDKIKTIFGFTPRKEINDGIEAYLQYRNGFEQGV